MSKSVGNVIDADAADRRPTASTRSAISCCARCPSAGRRLLAPRHGRPHQRRPRQRSRQSGAARAVDDQHAIAAAGCRRRARSPPRTRRCWRRARPLASARRVRRAGLPPRARAIWQVVADGNRYVDEQAPWTLRKSDRPRMETVLYVLAETIRHLAILVQPVVPAAAARCSTSSPCRRTRATSRRSPAPLAPGTALPKPEGIFPRYSSKGRRRRVGRKAGRGRDARRQPLPSRLRRFRCRAAGGAGAGSPRGDRVRASSSSRVAIVVRATLR